MYRSSLSLSNGRSRVRLGAMSALLTASLGVAASASAQSMHASKGSSASFPAVSELSVSALPRPSPDGSNAHLNVRYAESRELPQSIALNIDGRRYTLRRSDDDPARYSGALRFDFQAFLAEQSRRQKLADRDVIEPVFKGREIIRHQRVAFLDPRTLAQQIQNGLPINVPPDVVTGTSALMSPAASLMVVDPLVVEDPDRTFDACTNTGTPDGAWTFNTLMVNMANEAQTGINPSDFVEQWINNWGVPHTLNTFPVPARPPVVSMLLDNWPRDGAGRLILERSPLRLLAIVNRVDLRSNAFYGGGDAGEGRFVFGVMRRLPSGACSLTRFTVILEYGVPIAGCSNIKGYGQQWADLDALVLGAPAYNAALQAITDQFTSADAAPSKPNGSAINQIRTNEFAFPAFFDWELREFTLPLGGGLLDIVSTQMTPNREVHHPFSPFFAGSTLVADFINANLGSILANNYSVPESFLGIPFLTGASWNPTTAPGFVWRHPGIVPSLSGQQARRIFSLNTCDACHGGETQTNNFLHIGPRSMGFEADLSRFLVGDPPGSVTNPTTLNMNDPIAGTPVVYGDLLMRQQDLDALVGTSCLSGGLVGGLMSPSSVAISH